MTDLHLPEWRVVAVRQGVDPHAVSGWYVRAFNNEEAISQAREAGMFVAKGDTIHCELWKQSIHDEALRERARRRLAEQSCHDIAVDPNAGVIRSSDGDFAFVQAWIRLDLPRNEDKP